MSLIKTNNGRIVMKKASSMMFVPYSYDSNVGDYVLGSDVYDVSAIIGDSTVVEQEDGDKSVKNNEFKASPLLEIYSGGKFNFTAQCLDLQNSVLKSVFGAMTVSGINGAAAMNDDFVLVYALVRIRFVREDIPDVYLPKVQLNSKVFVNQLKTRASQGNIAGTALATYIAVESALPNKALQFSTLANGTSSYTPYTPMFFVPKTNDALIFHHVQNANAKVYTKVNFENGTVASDYAVSNEGGNISRL